MNGILDIYTVAFFGHRYIDNPFLVDDFLDENLRELLSKHEYVDFLIGRNGDFDQLCSSAVLRTKKNYRDDNSSLILVLPYNTAHYRDNQAGYEDYYDEIEVCFESAKLHPKSAIQKRNRYMVDRADLIICYIENNSGGAYQTIRYAEKRNKKIINIAKRNEYE